MKGFFFGLLVAALAFGGYLYWKSRGAGAPAPAAALKPDAGPVAQKKKARRGRGAVRLSRARSEAPGAAAAEATIPERPPELEPEPEPPRIKLTAADLKTVGQGDDLSRPDVIRLDMSNDQELPELSGEQIDARMREEEEAIGGCIMRARPDQETYIPGRVIIKFRIQRAGTVRGVRVEAPAILQKGGLYGCIKGVLGRVRFPPAGSSQIVTYPFGLS